MKQHAGFGRALYRLRSSCTGDVPVRLPTLPELAASAGVSVGTMRKAVLHLQKQGVLRMRPRTGILFTGAAAPASTIPAATPDAPPVHRPAWKRIRSAIMVDLDKGVFPPGSPLPYTKELSARYGACHRTMEKALGTLCDNGRIIRTGRRYQVPAIRPSRPGNTIVVIVRGTESDKTVPIGTWAPRNKQQYQALEHIAAQSGCSLEFAVFRYHSNRLVGADGGTVLPASIGRRDSVMGFMLWCQGLGGLDTPVFVQHLARFDKPIAILDVGMPPAVSTPAAATRLFQLGTDERCGEIMGRHLLDLGHRTVDYINRTDFRPRMNGLVRAFKQAGFSDAVRMHDLSAVKVPQKEGELDRIHAKVLKAISAVPSAGPFLRYFDDNQEELVDNAAVSIMLEHLEPHLNVILDQCTGTALVCETDTLALHCLRLLRNRGVRIPEEKSVAGFDDIEEAFLYGLSSYNFNVKAVISAMMEHVIRPGRGGGGGREPVVIEGFVNQRMSSGVLGQQRKWIQ